MKKLKKIIIVFLLVFLLTGCTKQLVVEKTNDEGKKTKVVVKYDEGKNATGQSLTKNILCKPTDEELANIYKENGVNTDKMVSCKEFTPTIKSDEGLWDNVFIKPLAWVILKLGYLVKNFGLAVILAGLAIRLVLYPVTKKSAMQSENLKKAQPELTRLEQKYKNRTDQESMMMKSQEMMMIYKKYEINPMSGCLFSFLQIPLFLAFYEALNRLPVIFEGHFLGLQLGTTPMAGISNEQYYYLIVIVLVIGASYLSMKLNSTASMSKEQAAQMKMMTNMMIVFLGIASVSLSTGIAIYWVTNSTFTILQNLLVKRRKEKNA